MSVVRFTQLDGKLPNLALMKLAHWHRERDDAIIALVNLVDQLVPVSFLPVHDQALLARVKQLVLC